MSNSISYLITKTVNKVEKENSEEEELWLTRDETNRLETNVNNFSLSDLHPNLR